MVTGLLLVVAVLAFAGLNYQQVPMSRTQTVTQTSTETEASYSAYLTLVPSSYMETNVQAYSTLTLFCLTRYYLVTTCAVFAGWGSTTTTETIQFANFASNTTTIPYSQTLTSSITESSTSAVPASAALGLTDGSFIAVAVIVIGVLAVLTAYLILKSRTRHKPKQATLSQFAK
jgi:Tfp pilus assembly protein PilV